MQAAQAQDPFRAMIRGGAVPTLVVGALALVVSVVVDGGRGAVGSLLATAVVVASFSSSLLLMGRMARLNPLAVLPIALLSYVTKVGLLGLMLLLLGGAEWMSDRAFSLTAVVGAMVWLAGEVRAFTRVRTLVFDDAGPGPEAPSGAVSMTER